MKIKLTNKDEPRKGSSHTNGARYRIIALLSDDKFVYYHDKLIELDVTLVAYHSEINTYEFTIGNSLQLLLRGDKVPFMKLIED